METPLSFVELFVEPFVEPLAERDEIDTHDGLVCPARASMKGAGTDLSDSVSTVLRSLWKMPGRLCWAKAKNEGPQEIKMPRLSSIVFQLRGITAVPIGKCVVSER
jgi:hypothetical protein